MRARTRSAGLAAAAAAAVAVSLATPSPAAVTCNFAGSVVSVSLGPGDGATLVRSGNTIHVNGAACGAATVTNTSKVVVTGAGGGETVTVDLTGGAFTPGSGAEATGAPDIELEVGFGTSGPDLLVVDGAAGPDAIRLGAGGVNLNNDDDADIVGPAAGDLAAMNPDAVRVNGLAGADTLSGAGATAAGGTPVAYWLPLEMNGGGATDALTGGDGADTLNGGAGADLETGAAGSDTFLQETAANGADTLTGGGDPNDTVDYSARGAAVALQVTLDDVADDGAPGEADNVDDDMRIVKGGAGDDTLTESSGRFPGRTLIGGPGDDVLTGGQNADTLYGCVPDSSGVPPAACAAGDGGDRLTGNGGNDWLYGGPGDDDLDGGDHNDALWEEHEAADNGADDLSGGAGDDLVAYRSRTASLTITMQDELANDGESGEGDNVRSDVENGWLGRGVNTVTGNAANNTFTGGDGVDTLRGLGGDDWLDAGHGDNLLYGGPGDDALYGANGSDLFLGEADDDVLGSGQRRRRALRRPGHGPAAGGQRRRRLRRGVGAQRAGPLRRGRGTGTRPSTRPATRPSASRSTMSPTTAPRPSRTTSAATSRTSRAEARTTCWWAARRSTGWPAAAGTTR